MAKILYQDNNYSATIDEDGSLCLSDGDHDQLIIQHLDGDYSLHLEMPYGNMLLFEGEAISSILLAIQLWIEAQK